MQNLLPALTPLAYIDGGSASLFFQALIGGILAGGFYFSSRLGHLWSRIKSLTSKSKAK